MFLTNNKYTECLFISINIIVILISGRSNDNNEITVDIDNTIDVVVEYPSDETDVIYFGFDVRPRNGFIEAHDEDYAQLRELAIIYDIIE
ncbi:MAG: hypothetical protein HF976_03795 [ANME-2 cluster archaeon]|nr:hypothetical protein [ANME-2 cluster archaeon]MBC2700528.1 hypothetical protein [ANME-2 cluster archaeon]MBC2706527.1 hypothetical protein [ANME-2 cluster archaeon]MBC2745838.1 hypothetical protein [ANME-2 cluster archaeon]